MKRVWTFATLLVAHFCAAGAFAQQTTTMSVELGWGELLRPGRWSLITVTATDTRNRQAILEMNVPQGGSYSMRVQQGMVLSPMGSTFQLYTPLRYGEALSITLRDANTGKLLAQYPEDASNSYSFLYNKFVNADARFVGVSGERTSISYLSNQIGKRTNTQLSVSHLTPRLLPETPIGYDSLDLLVLNRPDLNRITAGQQQAIIEWVRGGGNLLIWPNDDPVPENSPLAKVFPATVGGPTDIVFTKKPSSSLANIAGLRARALTPAAGATEIRLFPEVSDAAAYGRRLGLGRIVVCPINLALQPADDTYWRNELWPNLVAGMGVLIDEQDSSSSSSGYGYGVDPELRRQHAAVGTLQDHLANIPGIGQFGFSYVSVTLIALLLIVGPVDWIVLKMLGRQPWTWVTTAGWIGLVTVGAIFVGHLFKSGDLHYRTVTLIDQVDGETLGQSSLAMVYSPRTTEYHLDAPKSESASASGPDEPAGWWEPSSGEDYSRGTVKTDLDFHQTMTGNSPNAMYINVWNLRFLRQESAGPSLPLIEAKLAYAGPQRNRVIGTIKNLTDKPLTNVRIRVATGFAGVAGPTAPDAPVIAEEADVTTGQVTKTVRQQSVIAIQRIEPGATAAVDAAVVSMTMPATVQPDSYRYRYRDTAIDPVNASNGWSIIGDLSGRRTRKIDLLLRTGGYAAVYAEQIDPPPPAVLREPNAKQRHESVIRAVVKLEGAEPSSGVRQGLIDDTTNKAKEAISR